MKYKIGDHVMVAAWVQGRSQLHEWKFGIVRGFNRVGDRQTVYVEYAAGQEKFDGQFYIHQVKPIDARRTESPDYKEFLKLFGLRSGTNMTTSEMLLYTNRLKEIRKIQEPDMRNGRLTNLMIDIRTRYFIPAFASSRRIETVDPFAMRLYETVREEVEG